jgi:hypothetical protein
MDVLAILVPFDGSNPSPATIQAARFISCDGFSGFVA